MPGSLNSPASFIPKHNHNKGENKNSPRRLYVGNLLVRILFFATLVSAIGLYFYVDKLNTELNEAIGSFKSLTSTYEAEQDDVDKVTSIDKRLVLANDRFRNSVSLNALILAIQKSTLSTVQFKNLEISRISDNSIELSAGLRTDGFDSVIFQKELLSQSDELKNVEVSNVNIQYISTPEDDSKVVENNSKEITFQASIKVDPSSIRSVLITDGVLPPPIATPAPVLENLPAPGTGVLIEGVAPEGVVNSNQNNI